MRKRCESMVKVMVLMWCLLANLSSGGGASYKDGAYKKAFVLKYLMFRNFLPKSQSMDPSDSYSWTPV